MKVRQAHKIFEEAGIGEEYWDYSINNYKNVFSTERLKKIFRNYYNNLEKIKKDGIGLLLSGGNGTGKTGLAIEILKRALIKFGYSGVFISLTDYLELYCASWHSNDARADMKATKDVDFLVINDLCKEIKISEKQEEMLILNLESTLQYRTSRKKPIVITSNAESPDEITEIYGDTVGSLITGHFVKLKVSGSDYRKSQGRKKLRKVEENLWE